MVLIGIPSDEMEMALWVFGKVRIRRVGRITTTNPPGNLDYAAASLAENRRPC
jgi:hypothetical protein